MPDGRPATEDDIALHYTARVQAPTIPIRGCLRALSLPALLIVQACASPPAAPPQPAPPAPEPVIIGSRKPEPAAPPPAPVISIERAEMRVGDRLWYRGGEGGGRPATILREVVSLQGGQAQLRQFDVDGAGRPAGVARPRRQALESLELDNPGKVNGQIRYVEFPLSPGKSWSYRYQIKGRSGALTTYDITAKVEAEQLIDTPAGRFKVLRILHSGQWNVPVTENGSLRLSTGSLRSTVWFAPQLGNWVRFESEILNANGNPEGRIHQELVRLERR